MSGHPFGTWQVPQTGTAISHGAVIAEAARQQVVLLGETHDRFDVHRWQLHVAAGLLAVHGNIALGFEMFPRRVQPALDAFVAGDLDVAQFLERSEWATVWRFDPALYLPLFQFCRLFRIPMLALNCHRPLVTQVGKEGWDAIAEADRDGLTPAKPALDGYRRYLFDITGGLRDDRAAKSPQAPEFDRFVRAQQTWDRAFACNIARALDRDHPPLVIGIIGRGHLEHGYGTPFQLADLGVNEVSVLLPTVEPHQPHPDHPPIARALFRLHSSDGALL